MIGLNVHLANLAITVLSSMLALGWLWQALAALRGIPTLPDLAKRLIHFA